jgi:hypothetical protein
VGYVVNRSVGREPTGIRTSAYSKNQPSSWVVDTKEKRLFTSGKGASKPKPGGILRTWPRVLISVGATVLLPIHSYCKSSCGGRSPGAGALLGRDAAILLLTSDEGEDSLPEV